jgi:uncharacterized protein
VQMVIALFPSLEGESLEDYSIRLAQRWRIGQKGLDNGLILLVFRDERKVRVEVGYGLEPTITDIVASQIIRERIAPRFREGRYAAGLEAAVAGVFERIEAKAASPERVESPGARLPILGLVGFLGILGVIAVILLQEAFSSRRFLQRNGYTAGRRGWVPPIVVPPIWGGGWGGGRGGGSGGGGGFSGGGGGSFGGGGASGDW